MSRNRHAFTLVELIAVIVLIAVMAAATTVRFARIAEESRNGAARVGVNQALATLTLGFAKAYLGNGGKSGITAKNVTDAAGFTAGTETGNTGILFGDVELDVAADGHTVTLTARKVNGRDVTLSPAAWTVPPEFR
ncbi:MAG: type II secretion system protein [Lentisphaeria bacterium]|jgi:prepilin-type N-terminal cleavage/methylation domain-containing protein|nr:type II secretion system protein [Lentisphaeria bacterium]